MADYLEGSEERRSRLWLWILLALLVPFAGGIVASIYGITRYPAVAHWLRLIPAQEEASHIAQARRIVIAPAAPPPLAAPATAPDPMLADRLAEIQDKVDGIEDQARAATGDASRAEGLLVAFAARRALDRGSELGYIEALLRQRFGQSQPQAVAMILSASHQPVTLPDLQNGFDAISPILATNGGASGQSWWAGFRQQVAGLVVVRRVGEPSAQPADRVARAERMLEGGQVDGALAEILRLPDHDVATKWVVMARRYLAGRGALDRIETAALLDPAVTALAVPGSVVPPSPTVPKLADPSD